MGVLAPKQMQNAANLKLRCLISDSLIIHQQREGDASFFPEEICVSEVAQTYRRKLSPRSRDFALMLAQLRDVLPAEYSPVMAKKNKNSGTPFPQRPELYFASARIR